MSTKPFTVAAILQHDHKKFAVYLYGFDVPEACEDPVELLRLAIGEFSLTEEGQKIGCDNAQDFNWGDATTHIPSDWWALYGITPIPRERVGAVVDHDENFHADM